MLVKTTIMTRKFTILLALLSIYIGVTAQQTRYEEFAFGDFTTEGFTLPYRYIAPEVVDGKQPALVIFLHGRHASGTDNLTPITRKEVRHVADFVKSNIYAHYLVPQCPYDRRWAEKRGEDGSIGMSVVLKRWIDDYVANNNIDSKHIYIMGVSLGGGGVWRMLSDNPETFAAAITVASVPRRVDPVAVAKTPLLCILGEDDDVAMPSVVKPFIDAINDNNGNANLIILEGLDHGEACRDAFTEPNLRWLFKRLL